MCHRKAHAPRGRHHHHHRRAAKKRWWKNQMAAHFGYPPVNVEELDTQYEISLFAAGYEKSDFKISLEDEFLLVEVEKDDHIGPKDWSNIKYTPGSFKREFKLNKKIDADKITAQYKNGVLVITLPKLAGMETVRQDIEVS